jgi:hypothetical protein
MMWDEQKRVWKLPIKREREENNHGRVGEIDGHRSIAAPAQQQPRRRTGISARSHKGRRSDQQQGKDSKDAAHGGGKITFFGGLGRRRSFVCSFE